MNAQAHMSGQVPRRAPNQAGPQLAGLAQQKGIGMPSQMHGLAAHSMDANIDSFRQQMQSKIFQILQRRNNNPQAVQKLPEFAQRLEDIIYKDSATKDEYMNLTIAAVEQRIHVILKNTSNRTLAHHGSAASSIGTMIPTPGVTHNSNKSSLVSSSSDNSMIATSGTGLAAQTAINAGNLLATANGSTGSIPNRFQQSPANVAVGSGGNSIVPSIGMSRQLSQMMPTPGLNNRQPLSANVESSNGVGLSTMMDSTMVAQQQPVGSQSNRMLHSLGGQMGVGLRSNLQQKSSLYGVSEGVINGSLGMIGNNMHLGNGPAISEGYLNATSYGGSTKPLQQQFDQQHHQSAVQGDGYAVNASYPSVSNNLYGSTLSSMNNQNVNPMSFHSKSKANQPMLTHNTSLQPIQQPSQIKSQIYDSSQKNFQQQQSTRDHLLQSQHQIQNFQQQVNQPYGQLGQQQHQQNQHQHQQHQHNQHQQHQQNQHQQQLMQKTNMLRQTSMTSSFGSQLMAEHGFESNNGSLFPQSAEQFHLSELQSQYHQNSSAGSHSKNGHFLGHSGPQDFQSTFSQDSQQMMHIHQQATESQNDYSCLLSGSQPDTLQQGHWHPQTSQKHQMPGKSSFEHNIQEEFQQRLTGQEEAQQPGFEGCIIGSAAVTKSVSALQSSSGVASGPGNSLRERNYHNQKRWLLFMLHARGCPAPKGTCQEVNCLTVQQLLMHMDSCTSEQCGYPRCNASKKIFKHYLDCRAADCPVCIHVRKVVALNRKAHRRALSDYQISEPSRATNVAMSDNMVNKTTKPSFETSEVPESLKRMKVQHTYPLVVPKRESSPVPFPIVVQPHDFQDTQPQIAETMTSTKSEVAEVKVDSSIGSGQGNLPIFDNTEYEIMHTCDVELLVPNDIVSRAKQETLPMEEDCDIKVKQEANDTLNEPVAGSKSGKPKIKGVSLTELFTPEQIREHIRSLRQWVGQSKAKAEKNQAMERSMSENSCQLCAVEKLTFEPPPIYCTPCGARIKRNATYYTMGSGDTRHYFCIPCYNEARGDTIDVEGSAFPKAKLEKKKNDEETEEWWVQCDKCEAWQHQICALFNGRRNDGGQAEYTCPNCYIEEIEKGERKPLPQSAVLGAKDLPRTVLSDHIEQRLFKRLKQERQERARHVGKSFDEVPGAESLVIRVVSSVDKKLEVKQRFLEIFQEENYPTEYPYKSKVVLLFQKIEGVEVCLFGMYVQEFGSECQFPNQRRVYLSYLDSVKYFRPDIRTVTGEALRTFVYHEILIGYLEYCKKRGFTSCYIWACPPLKGEDYILYCHPEIQKTPKSDKLREWYLSMLRKATKENIVVELVNLYDHFFVPHGECKAKVTAARLPYFDGDYWPGAAEDMINQLRQEEDGRKLQKKGKTKKTLTKRALKAAGHTDLTGNASKDALLMQKLGETICPMKEDFIMVHLQHSCNHCCLLMASGTRWVCNQCKNFELCDNCHDAEQRLEDRERHPINSREKHLFYPVEVTDVPSDTKDKDEILESEFFDTRQAFLSLCQGNHYQYDTLRRAKHSSMMVLYHLHNPTAPAFVTTCNVCHHDIETGHGWRCEICPDFDVCNACYQKDGGVDHPHKLTNHPSTAERDAQNQEARQKRVLQLRKMLDLLVHASQCRYPSCQYPNCRKVKGLFRHGIQCKTRASGGCPLCKRMWYLLQLHSRACKESDCNVPRCRDLKEHLRRLQQQSDSRRRAAVMEMMRQRAAEVAGGTD